VGVEYEALDLAEMQNEYKRVTAKPGSNSGDSNLEKYVRLPDGEGYTLMRILPKKKNAKLWCATRIHTLFNPVTKERRTYHCPKNVVVTNRGESWQGDCIVCKLYSEMWKESMALSGKAQEDMQNQARTLKPVERYYYNVIVRSERDREGNVKKNVGPKIYSCGKTIHEKILRAILGDDVAGERPLGDITHPVTGRDFRVVKKIVKGGGGQEYPNYDNSKFDDVTPAGTPEEMEAWMSNLNDLQALRVLKSDEELKHALRVHQGIIKEGESQQDDDLTEFRNARNQKPQPEPQKLREDLAVKTEVPSSKSSDDEGILADDDFMKELESM
jgi:hypothetical protein